MPWRKVLPPLLNGWYSLRFVLSLLCDLLLMKILVWNCRGAGSKRFHGVIMDLLYLYKPDIVVLLETWVSGEKAEKVVRGLGFPSSHRVEPQGYSGEGPVEEQRYISGCPSG